MALTHLSDKDFEKEVVQSKQPVVVDFWAPWCGPCQMIGPLLEEIAKEYNGRVKICKVNIDENQATPTRYQILSIPTLLFFKEGKVINQVVGARSAGEICITRSETCAD